MLRTHALTHPAARSDWLKKFDPLKQTWVVSDLRSKFEIQNSILEQFGFYQDQMVLRASELWSLLLKRTRPDARQVSRDFLQTWIRQRLRDLPEVADRANAELLLFDTLNEFVAVFSHPSGVEIVQDWISQSAALQGKLEPWFSTAGLLFTELVEQGYVSSRWIAPLLSQENLPVLEIWQRPLILDLGAELSQSEIELIQQMALHLDVDILEPCLPNEDSYFFLKKPYRTLNQKYEGQVETRTPPSEKGRCFKMTAPLAEVKMATAEIRRWLDEGAAPASIGVLVPNVETYWPLVEKYFACEGIPVAKDLTTPLHSLRSIQLWLSRLRVAQRNFEYTDLEAVRFQELPAERFEAFEALFASLLDASDLGRDPRLQQAFSTDSIPNENLPVPTAIGLFLRFWPQGHAWDPLERVLREILETLKGARSSELHLSFAQWLYWLEQMTARLEVRLTAGDRRGVQFENLSSGDSPQLKYRIFLGLSDSQMQNSRRSLLQPAQIERLLIDTGFHCPHPEQSSLAFDMEWLALADRSHNIWSFPQTTTSGALETPHRLWLSRAPENLQVTLPERTRWDALQREALSPSVDGVLTQLRKVPLSHLIQVREVLKPTESVQAAGVFGPYLGPVSASDLQIYKECPFKFAASRLLKMSDPAAVDLDPNPRSAGGLVHEIFRQLVARWDHEWTRDELQELVDTAAQKLVQGDPQLWKTWRERYIHTAERFLRFERQLRAQAPVPIQTVATEFPFSIEFKGRTWRGTLDRVDQVGPQALTVYDYKAKDRSYRLSAWQKENHVQLAFYAWLIDRKKIDLWKDSILHGAYYYVYRDFSLIGAEDGQDKFVDLQDNLNWIESEMIQFDADLRAGFFPARPRDPDLCGTCRWNQICRAPHLNGQAEPEGSGVPHE